MTLMSKTLVALSEDVSDKGKTGSHLMLKVDIEGGEYALVNDVVKSGVLCRFIQQDNTVDAIIGVSQGRILYFPNLEK